MMKHPGEIKIQHESTQKVNTTNINFISHVRTT